MQNLKLFFVNILIHQSFQSDSFFPNEYVLLLGCELIIFISLREQLDLESARC